MNSFIRHAIMTQLNCATLGLLALTAFMVLAVYSQLPCVRYPLADACVDGVYIPVDQQGWTKEARLIMSVWNIKPEQVAKPVKLWSE